MTLRKELEAQGEPLSWIQLINQCIINPCNINPCILNPCNLNPCNKCSLNPCNINPCNSQRKRIKMNMKKSINLKMMK